MFYEKDDRGIFKLRIVAEMLYKEDITTKDYRVIVLKRLIQTS